MRRAIRIAVCGLCWGLMALMPGWLWAQAGGDQYSRREMPAVRTDTPPVIDGGIDDPCWANAPVASIFTDSQVGGQDCDQTEVKILYDDTAIYVAYHCFDPQPEKIVGRQTKRDSSISGEDYVIFDLDTFHQHDDASISKFCVNALGTPAASIAQGRAKKTEWTGDWTSAARIVSDGWTCEMAIPWEMLTYPGEGGACTMGINFGRYQQRAMTYSEWSDRTKQFYNDRAGHWVGVEPPVSAFRSALSLLPYALISDEPAQVGIDMRYTLTPTLTAVASANPDFSTIEEDVESIDFSYGPRYVADRRPFFQEGSEAFSTYTEAGLLFHSREIPDFDYGAKLYGQASMNTAIGALVTSSAGGRTDAVARVVRNLSETAQCWLVHVGRYEDAGDNRVTGAGFNSRFGGLTIYGDWAGSAGADDTRGTAADFGGYLALGDWSIGALGFHVQPNFMPADGYLPFADYRGYAGEVAYHHEWRDRSLQGLNANFSYTSRDHYDGSLFRSTYSFVTEAAFTNDLQLLGAVEWGEFEGFRDRLWQISASGRASDTYRSYGLTYSEGMLQGERYSFWGPYANFKLGNAMRAGISSQLVSYVEWGYQHILTINYDFSPRRGVAGRLVSQDGDVNWYLAFRQSGYVGSEVYVIWGDPNAREFEDRLAVKLVWPL